jgi:hypothetical protein
LLCARVAVETAAVAAMTSNKPRILEEIRLIIRFMEAPWQRAALACGLTPVRSIMPQALRSGKSRHSHANPRFSAKRNDSCEAGTPSSYSRLMLRAYSAKRKVRTGSKYARFGACRNRSDQVRRPRKRVGLSLAATTSAKLAPLRASD